MFKDIFGGGFSNLDLSDKFIESFGDRMAKCYDGVSFADLFETKLNAKMDTVLADFGNQNWLGDSTILEIKKVGQQPQVVIQDLSMRSNFDCFYKAVTFNSKSLCEKSHNLVYFKLSDDSG